MNRNSNHVHVSVQDHGPQPFVTNIDKATRQNTNYRTAMGPAENRLHYKRPVSAGFAVFVPAGTWHNVVNTGKRPLKIYTIYAPPHHPHGTVQATKAIADMEEEAR